MESIKNKRLSEIHFKQFIRVVLFYSKYNQFITIVYNIHLIYLFYFVLGLNAESGVNGNILDDPHGLGFTCALCGKGFGVNKHHCRRHIKNFHNLAVTVLRCDVCMKTYKNNDSLKNHLRITHGIYKK